MNFKRIEVLLFILIFSIISCSTISSKQQEQPQLGNEIVNSDFDFLFDSAQVKGSILIYDLVEDTYFSNDFDWNPKGNLPASTFKITNSIIALETGVVENDSSLFKWDSLPRRMKIWEQDLLFRDAFHFSCVPCYQELARKIGTERMISYLAKLNYGNMELDANTLDIFWLEGESKITQKQQIDFLKRFYQAELQISKSTEEIMKRMMLIEETEAYKLSGKTGWSIRNGNNNGWFVGYLETKNKTFFFAVNVEPTEDFNMKLFSVIRKDIAYKAFQKMAIIN